LVITITIVININEASGVNISMLYIVISGYVI